MKRTYSIASALFVGLLAYLFFTAFGRPTLFASLANREGMVNKKCPDGTRSDGPCLLEFPGF